MPSGARPDPLPGQAAPGQAYSARVWSPHSPCASCCSGALTRATGIKAGPRPLRVLRDGLFYYRPGLPAGIAITVVELRRPCTELLPDRPPPARGRDRGRSPRGRCGSGAQQALLRAIRQDLRGGRSGGVTARPDPLIHLHSPGCSICGLAGGRRGGPVEFAALRDAAGIQRLGAVEAVPRARRRRATSRAAYSGRPAWQQLSCSTRLLSRPGPTVPLSWPLGR